MQCIRWRGYGVSCILTLVYVYRRFVNEFSNNKINYDEFEKRESFINNFISLCDYIFNNIGMNCIRK